MLSLVVEHFFSHQRCMVITAERIGALAGILGFAPINLGGLSEGGLLVQARGRAWGRLIFKDLIPFQ